MTPCIEWFGCMDRNGYGKVHRGGKVTSAHRWTYEQAHGPLSANLVVDHLCRNRACVNIDHLEAVTNLENMRRGERASQTHCKNGHAFDDANTYSRAGQGRHVNGRGCRKCIAAAARRYKTRLRAVA